MDLGALRVSELNEGGDIFCSLPPLNDRPMLSKCKCIGNSYHVLVEVPVHKGSKSFNSHEIDNGMSESKILITLVYRKRQHTRLKQ